MVYILPLYLDLVMIYALHPVRTPNLELQARADYEVHFEFSAIVLGAEVVPVPILALHVSRCENSLNGAHLSRTFSSHA